MSRTYVIADLHGRRDLLDLALEAIDLHAEQPGTVVFLGDYVDRGPKSAQVIERLVDGPGDSGWDWVCLAGNHEQMMLDVCRHNASIPWWLTNGGGATLVSYGHPIGALVDLRKVTPSHLDWIEGLRLVHADKHRVYVHAGVNPSIPLYKQDSRELTWKRYQFTDPRGHGDRHVIHGHEQYEDGPHTHGQRTMLDTFAWASGRLAVAVFEDELPGPPVEYLTIQGEPHELYESLKEDA